MHVFIHDNIDDLAAFEFVVERDNACDQTSTVLKIGNDARTRTMIADIGMNTIRQVERRGAARQIFHLAFGCKHKNLFLENVTFDRFHKFVGVLRKFALPLAQLFDPGNHLARREARAPALFQVPVAGDAVIGDALHFMRTNLNLSQLIIQAEHCRVQ